MTNQQKGLILLIKSAITGEAYTLPTDFDIVEAFEIAKTHGITAIVYYGAHNCGIGANTDVMKENLTRVYKQIMVCTKQDAEIHRILDAFETNEIDYMPLKGIHLRKLYTKPEMRRMGDADILIKTAQYDRIRPLMIELGYIEGEETGHELHWVKGISNIELHKCLIAPSSKDYYAYFGDGWGLAKVHEANTSKYSMTNEDEFIYLFAHFAKHYRAAGIGIRHIVDLQVFKANMTGMDEDYICTELSKLGMLEFYKNITATLNVWFDGATANEKTDFITQVIFTSGEYGKHKNRVLSSVIKESENSGTTLHKHDHVIGTLFVGYDRMCTEYPFLKKCPILLPLMWVVYLFKRLFEKNRLKHFISVFTSYKDSEVSDYRNSLRYVGLDFNFTEEE